ncbi:MAG: hypothetical protein MZW92_51965 [Comamonadaceae bacterium]|nr:hypothetical protein [Comamonadaceae bacterium]
MAREMGADVDHRGEPRHAAAASATRSTAMLGVSAQMLSILTEQNVQASLAAAASRRTS